MIWDKVAIGSFLKERTARIKPAEANKMGLKRIEKIDFSGTYHLVEKPTNTDMILVKNGDLLISGINAEKGAITVYNENEDALATIHYSSYEFNKKKIDIEYFRWFLISDAFKTLLKSTAGGGIKTELKAKHLLPLEILLPGIEEQKLIVEKIIRKHGKLAQLQNLIESQTYYLTLLRQSILQEAVQGKLVPQDTSDEPAEQLLQRIKAEKAKLVKKGKLKKEKELPPITEEEIPFELPKGWVWCRMGEICCNVDYGTSEKATSHGEVPVLRMGNIQDGELVYSNLKYVSKDIKDLPKLYLKNKDLVFNRTNSFELVGKAGIYNGNEKEFTLASYLIRVSLPTDLISVEFVNIYINSTICRQTQIEPQITQQTGQANFSGSKLKNIIFPLPPHFEQQRIIAKVKRLLHSTTNLEEQVLQSKGQSQHLLQTILREAFAGEQKEYAENEALTMAAEE